MTFKQNKLKNAGYTVNAVILIISGIILISALLGSGVWYYQLTTQKVEVVKPPVMEESIEVMPKTEEIPAILEEEVSPKPEEIPPEEVAPPTVTPFQLKSNFLKNEPVAQAIASGAKNTINIREFKFKYGPGDYFYSSTPFAYRAISAIRMLGYLRGFNVGSPYTGEVLLNKYQLFNNLPTSSLVTADILQRIDNDLAVREEKDRVLANRFPLFPHFIEAPLNAPTKEHSAALFTIAFESLPNSLVAWTEENFKDYVRLQLRGHLKDPESPNYQFCDIFLYSELADECGTPVYKGIPQVNKAANFNDDLSTVNTKIHEYAHFLDRNLYTRNPNTSQGLIDTSDFYAISYDTSSPYTASNGVKYYPLRRPDALTTEFTNAYARGWEQTIEAPGKFTASEDFAETFTMYVTAGKVLRELAKLDIYLQQKYNWLKQNVFDNEEYESGKIVGTITSTQQKLKEIIGSSFANFGIDYSQIIPDYVWNYSFIEGSVAFKPSR